MLPFGRMLKYGNIAPIYESSVIKMQAPSAFSNNTLMILYKNQEGDRLAIPFVYDIKKALMFS